MGVSAGFQRKIEDWMIGEDWSVAFRPFLATANPYKAKIMLVGTSTQPKVDVDDLYIESLLNLSFFEEYYQFSSHSRENKGIVALANKLKDHTPVLISNLNTLMVDSAKDLTAQKNTSNYERGIQVFQEVLEEFAPQVLILHGADTVKQFRKQFAEELQDDYADVEKVQELEEIGVFAQLQLKDQSIQVMACRSLGQFGTGSAFKGIIEKIHRLIG